MAGILQKERYDKIAITTKWYFGIQEKIGQVCEGGGVVVTNTLIEIFWSWRNGVLVVSAVFEGGTKGDVASGLARALGGSCWRP